MGQFSRARKSQLFLLMRERIDDSSDWTQCCTLLLPCQKKCWIQLANQDLYEQKTTLENESDCKNYLKTARLLDPTGILAIYRFRAIFVTRSVHPDNLGLLRAKTN